MGERSSKDMQQTGDRSLEAREAAKADEIRVTVLNLAGREVPSRVVRNVLPNPMHAMVNQRVMVQGLFRLEVVMMQFCFRIRGDV